MPTRLSALAAAFLVVFTLAGCAGGDSSPDDAVEGGIPPQTSISPRDNIGQSEGYPDADAQQEATQ